MLRSIRVEDVDASARMLRAMTSVQRLRRLRALLRSPPQSFRSSPARLPRHRWRKSCPISARCAHAPFSWLPASSTGWPAATRSPGLTRTATTRPFIAARTLPSPPAGCSRRCRRSQSVRSRTAKRDAPVQDVKPVADRGKILPDSMTPLTRKRDRYRRRARRSRTGTRRHCELAT